MESDNDLKSDCDSELDPTHNNPELQSLDSNQENAIWWIVAFTCVLQTLHSLPLGVLLKFLISWLILV